MALQTKGILGPISGKVGDKVYSRSAKGTCYVKSLPRKSQKPASPAQISQRHKVKIASRLISEIRDFLIESAHGRSIKYFGTGYTMRSILTNCFSGSYPDLTIHYDRMLLSKGCLARPHLLACQLDSKHVLQLSWAEGSCQSNAYPSDQLIVFICEETHGRIWNWPAQGVTRAEEHFSVDCSRAVAGQVIHCWLAFKSVCGKYSDSVHAGSFEIPLKNSAQ